MGDENNNVICVDNVKNEKTGKVTLSNKKVSIHLGVKWTVAKRIDMYAYRAGMIRHNLIEHALKYAIKHKLDVNKIAKDPAIQTFLRPQKNDVSHDVCARIDPRIIEKIEKMARKQRVTQQIFASYAVAYYIIYVLKLVNLKYQS